MQNRVNIWLDPMPYYDKTPGSGQLVESLFGMAWGGLIGRGFGDGSPERIPFAESDFIIGAIGEELGLTGVIAVILIYGLIVERALRAALICRDGFGKLMATGLATVLALQVFVVIGGVTRLIPLTGLTTPFLSYGGSSLVANWVIVALLLRISDQARRPVPDLSSETTTTPTTRPPRSSRWEVPGVNKPIRTISIFCLLLFLALMVNATWLQYWKSDDYDDDPRNRRVDRGGVLPRARRDPGRPRAGRGERARRRQVRVPAHLPRAVQVRPRHRLLLLLQPDRHRAEPERRALRRRRPAVRHQAGRPAQQQVRARAATSS